jgi:hypothetical protein
MPTNGLSQFRPSARHNSFHACELAKQQGERSGKPQLTELRRISNTAGI